MGRRRIQGVLRRPALPVPSRPARRCTLAQPARGALALVIPTLPPPCPQFIAAAGNDGVSTVSYPGGYSLPPVIAVAALQSDGALASYSNRGTWVHLGAPGSSIRSTASRPNERAICCWWPRRQLRHLLCGAGRRRASGAAARPTAGRSPRRPPLPPIRHPPTPPCPTPHAPTQTPGNTYATYSGTSMATPHVSGAAALYKARWPQATADQVKDAILKSATATASLGNGRTSTGGRLNAGAMLARTPGGGTPTCACGTRQYCVSGVCYPCPSTW